jgi:uncharacterized membrane protein YphA (DoxX/SURF4 family)
LQVLFGVYFVVTGISHFTLPPGLPPLMAWMYELPTFLHYISGTAEILGGLGLVLPGLTRIQTRLTPLAALGLVFVMVAAAIWHVPRNEFQNVVMTWILAGILGFVAYGRWKLSPLKGKVSF